MTGQVASTRQSDGSGAVPPLAALACAASRPPSTSPNSRIADRDQRAQRRHRQERRAPANCSASTTMIAGVSAVPMKPAKMWIENAWPTQPGEIRLDSSA